MALPVPATAPDVTHNAVDSELASGGKIMVVQSAGTHGCRRANTVRTRGSRHEMQNNTHQLH